MRFTALNLGCKVNAYETESVASLLEEKGYERVGEDEQSDVFIVFTCAVTNTAAAKSRKVIHRARRSNPGCVLIVAGCYSQIDPDALKEADILIGSAGKLKIPGYIDQFLRDRVPVREVRGLEKTEFENMTIRRFSRQTRAYLRIQDGCDQFCSYCIIPYARGRERSMEPGLAVKTACELARNHREIVLTGIHTGRYGKEHGISLASLMKRILAEAEGLERLRISSIEVTELDDEFVSLLKEEKKIARHLHVPLQSGCDRVLQGMHRPYTTAEYLARIGEIRREVPGLSVSCDLITGFPGESEEDHRETMAFLEACRFSFIHVFPYSPRAGTIAAARKDQVPPDIKKQRTAECLALSERLYDTYKDSRTGGEGIVLCETCSDGRTRGYTSDYLPLIIPGEYEPGTMIPVIIKKREQHDLYGERRAYEADGTV